MLSHTPHSSHCFVSYEKRRKSDAWTSSMPSGRFSKRSSVPGGGKMGEADRRIYACGVERRVVDLTHGCSLARSASSLSALSDLSSTLPTVAALRAAYTFAAETGRRLARPREARSERIVHRRQFQFGEQGGSSVGPTKRGKGSKIMAIADRHGLPLAVHVVSASPNEATLVEPTLQRRFLRETPQRLMGDKAYDSDPLDQQVLRTFRRRFDRAASLEPEQTSHSGRPRVASLPPSLENRASVCLVS